MPFLQWDFYIVIDLMQTLLRNFEHINFASENYSTSRFLK